MAPTFIADWKRAFAFTFNRSIQLWRWLVNLLFTVVIVIELDIMSLITWPSSSRLIWSVTLESARKTRTLLPDLSKWSLRSSRKLYLDSLTNTELIIEWTAGAVLTSIPFGYFILLMLNKWYILTCFRDSLREILEILRWGMEMIFE